MVEQNTGTSQVGDVEGSTPRVVRITDPNKVEKLFKVRPEFAYIKKEIIQMVAASGAIMRYDRREGDPPLDREEIEES